MCPIEADFTNIDKGIPQGSSLGLFTILHLYLRHATLCCSDFDIHLYAYDTVLYCSKPILSVINVFLRHDFDTVQEWLLTNKLLLNKAKSYSMLFQRKTLATGENNLNLHFLDSSPLESLETFKYLDVWLEAHLSFKLTYRLPNSNIV